MMKYVRIFFQTLGVISFILILAYIVTNILLKDFAPDFYSDKSIANYQIIYNKISNENFVSGEFNDDRQLTLVDANGNKKQIDFSDYKGQQFRCDVKKNFRGDIILIQSGGILAHDREIIFTDYLVAKKGEYYSINNVRDNIFICELRY